MFAPRIALGKRIIAACESGKSGEGHYDNLNALMAEYASRGVCYRDLTAADIRRMLHNMPTEPEWELLEFLCVTWLGTLTADDGPRPISIRVTLSPADDYRFQAAWNGHI